MNYQDYIDFCKTTESLPDSVTVDKERFDAVVKLFMASSELLDMLKKNIFYERDIPESVWLSHLKTVNTNINHLMEQQSIRLNHPANRDTELNVDVRIAHSIIGMCTETGELLEALNNSLTTGEFDTVNFGEELGDLHWYAAIGTDAANQKFDQILQTNKTKLEKRFNKGKFDKDDANSRNLDAERTILEDGFEQTAVISSDVPSDVQASVEIDVADTSKQPETEADPSSGKSLFPWFKKGQESKPNDATASEPEVVVATPRKKRASKK